MCVCIVLYSSSARLGVFGKSDQDLHALLAVDKLCMCTNLGPGGIELRLFGFGSWIVGPWVSVMMVRARSSSCTSWAAAAVLGSAESRSMESVWIPKPSSAFERCLSSVSSSTLNLGCVREGTPKGGRTACGETSDDKEPIQDAEPSAWAGGVLAGGGGDAASVGAGPCARGVLHSLHFFALLVVVGGLAGRYCAGPRNFGCLGRLG